MTPPKIDPKNESILHFYYNELHVANTIEGLFRHVLKE